MAWGLTLAVRRTVHQNLILTICANLCITLYEFLKSASNHPVKVEVRWNAPHEKCSWYRKVPHLFGSTAVSYFPLILLLGHSSQNRLTQIFHNKVFGISSCTSHCRSVMCAMTYCAEEGFANVKPMAAEGRVGQL
jgi:hypothetical protein